MAEQPSERLVLHGLAVAATGPEASGHLLADFDAWCAAREAAHAALLASTRSARCETGQDAA